MDSDAGRWEKWNHFPIHSVPRNRVPKMQVVVFERSIPQVGKEGLMLYSQLGLSVNVSHTGICLMVEEAPAVGEILRAQMPMAITGMSAPTLADVRWVRTIPFQKGALSLVGLKFLL